MRIRSREVGFWSPWLNLRRVPRRLFASPALACEGGVRARIVAESYRTTRHIHLFGCRVDPFGPRVRRAVGVVEADPRGAGAGRSSAPRSATRGPVGLTEVRVEAALKARRIC